MIWPPGRSLRLIRHLLAHRLILCDLATLDLTDRVPLRHFSIPGGIAHRGRG